MSIRRMLVWTATAVSFFLLGVPAKAEDRAFDIPLQVGQGVSGNIKLHVSKSAGDDLIVTVDEATITYMPQAGFNSLDETGGNLEIQGLLLVPQLGGEGAGAEARVLVPFVNLQKRGVTYSCTACGEGVVLKETLARSDSVIPALVVSNLIIFMPQENLAAGVAEPETKLSTDVATESSAERLARIARTANLTIASLPNLQDLQAEDYSLLQSALDGIADETGLDAGVKSLLASAVTQAANMAFSPILEKFVFEKFGLQSQIILKGIVANPVAYAQEAGNGASVDFLKGIAIGIAGGMAADAVFSLKPLADLPPKWKEPMRAMTKATVVETINLGTSAVDPSVAAAGIANRLYEFYQIYKASVALADTQIEAVVAAAIGLETAARLVTLNPSEKNNEIARSTIASTATNLNEAFGDGYNVAMTEIVNLTFVGLLSEFRGDTDRAVQMVAHIREKGKLGSDDAFPDVLAHPINWIASFATWSGDPPSRVAALMISTTALNKLEAPKGTVAPTEMPRPPVVTSGGRWGPDIVPQNGFDVGSINWGVDCSKADAKKCLSDRGLSSAAVDFNLAAFPDNPSMGVATEFRELGLVDWVKLSVIYSPYEATLLVNGEPNIFDPELTRDIATTFTDSASQSMLRRFPQASAIGGQIVGYRALPNGQQRFVFMETVFDGCHACDVLGSAVTFLDFDANGTLTTRQPIGLLLGDPDDDENMTAELIQRRPESFQVSLNARGYDAGPMDGLPGPQSRSALMDFQVEHCLPPTGQLNDQIANAILSSDGFTTPCADARMPLGISANTPLLSGTYVDSPEKCQSEYLSELENATSLWIIRGLNHQTSGYDNSCTVRRTDISKDLTKFTADCTLEGSAPGPVQWLADVKANNEFTTWNGEAVGSGMSFTRCADDTPLARANTDQSAAASALPVVAADIKTYCAAMTDADGPGEDGTNDAEIVASGANTWRCMDGEVLVCDLGASGRACMQTSQPSEQVLAEMNDFCRKNANSDYIAGYLIGGLADEWRCDGTKPVVVGNIPVDRLGYFLEAWRALDTTDAAANGADLVTENTTATPLESIASSAFDGRYADQAKTIVPISSISWTELMAMGSLLGMPESEIGKNIEVEGSETFATRDFRAKLVSDILLAKEHLPKNIESIRFVANYATWIPNYDFDNGRFDFCFPELLSLPVQSLRTVFSDDGQASASISSLLVVEADGLVDLPYVVTPCWVGSSSDGMYTPSVPNWPQFESSRLVKGIIGGWEGGNLDLKIVNGLYISISEADAERLDKIMRDNAMDNGSAYPQIEVAFLCNISLNGSLDTLVCNVDEVRIGFSEGVGDLLIATRRDGSEKWNIEFGSGMQ